MRKLSQEFIGELKTGVLMPILRLAKLDSTLCLEIRNNYINIYYRGGNIIRIEEKQEVSGEERRKFKAKFDRKYLDRDSTKVPDLPGNLDGPKDIEAWVDAIPFLKHEMDLWFGEHSKNEREFQQLMVRENNFGSSAKSTDYFICDIEYANLDRRFDLIAVHWPSSSTDRKNNKNLRLAFIEMKYLDNALAGGSGLKKHIEDINKFLGEPEELSKFKNETKTVFNQKLELGLIESCKPIESFSDDKPEFILALSNHDPDSSILERELKGLPDCPNAEIKVVTSNFIGYGLYSQGIYNLDNFFDKFRGRI